MHLHAVIILPASKQFVYCFAMTGSVYVQHKRHFATLLLPTVAFAIAASAGCGSGSSTPPSAPPPLLPPAASAPAAPAEAPRVIPVASDKLLPRKLFFADPDKAQAKLSYDGKHISFMAPKNGVMNIWVAPAHAPEKAKMVTSEAKRNAAFYLWTYTPDYLVYGIDEAGNENYRLISVNVATGKQQALTPEKGVRAALAGASYKHPKYLLVGLNERDPKWFDVYRIDVVTGKRELVRDNTDEFSTFLSDNELRLRIGSKERPDGSKVYYDLGQYDRNKAAAKAVSGAKGAVKDKASLAAQDEPLFEVGYEDTLTTGLFGFDSTGRVLYMSDSRGRNTSALVHLDMTTGKTKTVASDDKADIANVTVQPRTGKLQAASSEYLRTKWHVLDPAIQADMDYLKNVYNGELSIISRSLDDTRWLVAYKQDQGPVRYYRYDRNDKEAKETKGKKATFLFTDRSALENVKLAKMHPLEIRSRDGLQLVSYLTLPLGSNPDGGIKPRNKVPMVLLVHGGPWWRDSWGYDGWVQWLASRGYAVLNVNFRGSRGFGKAFVNAADLEWGRKMHDDLVDAVKWAVDQQIAQPDKIAIMGGSYGGYSTLVGLTMTPEVFACGVDLVGPSSLITFIQTAPPYWKSITEMLAKRVGDIRTEEGKKLLIERSPLTYVDKIVRPLLIAQGANDPRVKQSESDQIVKAMNERKIPVTYLLYPDEGHGFRQEVNMKSFFAVTEVFLAQCLGGPYEPFGSDLNASSIQVPAGADEIYGLSDALRARK